MDAETTQKLSLAEIERAAIEATLVSTGGNKAWAARILGISKRTIVRKLREYGSQLHGQAGL